MDGGLTYNSNSLQTFNPTTRVGINTNAIEHTDVPDSIANLYIVANANDSTVPNQEYPSRTIRLKGTIHGSTQADLDSRIDTFKGYFAQRNKNLDINYSTGVRRYNVMKANAVGISREDKALFASFNVELICGPFGLDTTDTNMFLNLIANPSFETDITGHTASGWKLGLNGAADVITYNSGSPDLSGGMTVETVIKLDTYTQTGQIFETVNSASARFGLYNFGNGILAAGYYNGSSYVSKVSTTAADITDGVWYHIVFTFSSTTSDDIRMWINGVEQTGNSQPILGATSGQIRWGEFIGEGKMLRVWFGAISAVQALALYRGQSLPSNSMHLEWLCGDGTGTTVADTTGNGITGTLSSVTWVDNRPVLSQSAAQAYSGTKSLLATHAATSPLRAGSTITIPDLTVGVTYTLSAYFYQASATDYLGICLPKKGQASVQSNGSWNRVTLTFVADATTQVVYFINYSGRNLFYVDAVQFEVGSTATDFSFYILNNITAATATWIYDFAGTAPYQLPVFTITINALTGAGDYIQLANDNNGQEILIYGQSLEADDVIVIDCAERTVTLNGTEIDYSGTLLEFEPGANSITYTDGFTTRTVDVTIAYKKRYL